MTELLLTDDELAAWIAEHPGSYSPILPTVDLSDKAGLFSSVNRGVRSMAVRSAGSESSLVDRMRDLVGESDGGIPVLGVRQKMSAPGVFRGSTFSITRRGSSYICDLVTENGVHKMWSASLGEVTKMVKEMLSGFTGEQYEEDEYLGFYAPVPGKFNTMAVCRRGVVDAEVTVDESRIPHFDLGDAVSDVGSLIERVLSP